MKKALGIAKNFLLKVSATLITTGMQQIVVLPAMAYAFDSSTYGLLLTVIGVANTIQITLGNSLNNTRLIRNADYEQKQEEGDFNALALCAGAASVIGALIIALAFYSLGPVALALLALAMFLGTVVAYYSVYFTLKLEFLKALIYSMVSIAGMLVGIVLMRRTMLWPWPMLISNLFSFFYLRMSTPLMAEPFCRTSELKSTLAKWGGLICVSLLGNVLVYLDRLLLYPIMGGEAVAIYSTASFMGKIVNTLMIPIANVLLGYFSQSKFRMDKRMFCIINGVSLGIGAIALIAMSVVSPIITRVLYPTLYLKTTQYLFVANLAALLGAVSVLAQSAVLRLMKMRLLIFIQVAYGLIYVCLGFALLSRYGLMGFCFAAIIANTVKFLALSVLGFFAMGTGDIHQTTEMPE